MYQILSNDEPLVNYDSYSEALNHMVRLNNKLHEKGFVVSPILNGQFVYYEQGKDADDGTIVEISNDEDR